MNIITPKFEILEQPAGLDGMYKMIEIAGRTLNTYNMNYE